MKQPELTDHQKELFEKLTKLQRRVVIGVIGGLSQTQAYIEAGGKGKTPKAQENGGSEIMGNQGVKAFYDSVITNQLSAAIMSREETLERLSLAGRTTLSDLVEFGTVQLDGPDGKPYKQAVWHFKDSADLDKEGVIITELSATKDGLKIKANGQLTALKQLSEMQGWNKQAGVTINNQQNVIVGVISVPEDKTLEDFLEGHEVVDVE